jgi:hypothetical protein
MTQFLGSRSNNSPVEANPFRKSTHSESESFKKLLAVAKISDEESECTSRASLAIDVISWPPPTMPMLELNQANP